MHPAAAPVKPRGGGRNASSASRLLAVRAARSGTADVNDPVPVRLESLAGEVEPFAVCRCECPLACGSTRDESLPLPRQIEGANPAVLLLSAWRGDGEVVRPRCRCECGDERHDDELRCEDPPHVLPSGWKDTQLWFPTVYGRHTERQHIQAQAPPAAPRNAGSSRRPRAVPHPAMSGVSATGPQCALLLRSPLSSSGPGDPARGSTSCWGVSLRASEQKGVTRTRRSSG